MGRTLTSIVAVGAAIAVNVIPGIGQAISGTIIGGLYGAGVAAGTAVAIGTAVTSAITLGVTAYGLQAGSSLLGLGPSLPKPDTTVTAIKNPRPPRVSAYGRSRLYGAYALYETNGMGTAIDAYAFHDGQADGIEACYLGDLLVASAPGVVSGTADGQFGSGKVEIDYRLGLPTETAFSQIVAALPGIWTSSHRGDGVVTGMVSWAPVKSKDFLKVYPNGQPPLSLVGRWQLCPDPRVEDWLDPATWIWTENPVCHLLHYKIVREGIDAAAKIVPTLAYWQAAADDCDDPTALKAGGTEARYRSCVAHKHTDAHKDVTAAITATFDGWLAPRADGALIVHSGRYYVPTVTIGPDEIVSYQWDGAGIDDDKAVNEIIVGYVSAEHAYSTVEGDAWRDEDDITARGQVLSQALDVQVPSFPLARRLAKRKMARAMAPFRGTIATNVAGRIVRGHRFVHLDIIEAGATFYSGPAEITALTRNMQTGGVTFSWVAADPDIDAWSPATEEGEPAALGDRVASEPLDAPTITTAAVDFGADSGASSTGAFLHLTIDAPDRDDLTWYARTRLAGAAIWGERQYTDIDPGTSVLIDTEFVPTDATIEVEVAYSVGDGRASPWSVTETVDTSTAGIAPTSPTNVSATGGAGQITNGWRNPASINFSYNRTYLTAGTTFTSPMALMPDYPGSPSEPRSETFTGVTPGTYYVWDRAFNATGAGSTPVRSASSVTVT